MENEKWYSFAEAGRKAGKSRAYFSYLKKAHPEYFENVELRKVGNSYAINDKGIKVVQKRIKKVGDRLRILLLNAVCKVKKSPLLLPNRTLYQK